MFQPRKRNFKNKNNQPPQSSLENSRGKGDKPCYVCGRSNHLTEDRYIKKNEAHKSKLKKF